jgi:hypothetical protein
VCPAWNTFRRNDLASEYVDLVLSAFRGGTGEIDVDNVVNAMDGLSQRELARGLGPAQQHASEIAAAKPSIVTDRLFAVWAARAAVARPAAALRR